LADQITALVEKTRRVMAIAVFLFFTNTCMKKTYKILLHFFFWFYKFGWGGLVAQYFNPEIKFTWKDFVDPLSLSHYVLFPLIFYINYFFILPRFYKKGLIVRSWISWILLLGLFILLRYLVQEVLFMHWLGFSNYYPNTTIAFYIFDNIYFGGSLIVMSFFIWSIIHLAQTEKEKRLLQQQQFDAEVSFLKNQVNPHFLFNTLNNIYSLSYKKDDQAPESILKLSGLMRYMLKDSTAEKVALKSEVEYIRNFIDLQKLRYKAECYINFTADISDDEWRIPPLLFIPFVENAFKHGIVTDAAYPLEIIIQQNKTGLQLTVKNKKNTDQKDDSSGIGLNNVKRRLQLLFPQQHQLIINDSANRYTCDLTIRL
jgi:sensor histidine kinase YesM